jgi:D-aspartate ligase
VLSFLRDIGYRGFSNFDLLRHPQSGEFYLLEMNLRQGRSNHYMTAAGLNPAGLILADLVEHQDMEPMVASPDVFWYSAPLSVVYSRLKDVALRGKLADLIAAGRAVSPFHMPGDLTKNPLRRLYVFEHERRARKRNREEGTE